MALLTSKYNKFNCIYKIILSYNKITVYILITGQNFMT